MSLAPKRSVTATLVISFAISALSLVGLNYIDTADNLKASARGAGVVELRHLLSLEKAVLEAAVRAGEEGGLCAVFRELNRNPRVTRALLVAPDRLVVASTRPALIGMSMDGLPPDSGWSQAELVRQAMLGDEARVSDHPDQEHLFGFSSVQFVEPGESGSPRKGAIYIELDLAAVIHEQVRALGSRGQLHVLAVLCVSLLLGLFLYLRVTRRLMRLVAYARRIGQEGHSARCEDGVRGADEIGKLASAMHEMSAERYVLEIFQERMAAAFEQAADPAFICGLDASIRVINPALERVYGFEREQVIGKTPRIFSGKLHDESFYCTLWDTLLQGEVWRGRVQNRSATGEILQFDMTISPVRDRQGRVIEFYATQRDVTQFVALEQQLLQAQKLEAVGQLAGGIAHDFNNLLTVILGYVDISLAGKADPNLICVRQAAEHASALTRQLLEFGRQGSARPEPTRLGDLLSESRSLLKRLLPENIELSIVMPEQGWSVLVDPTQIQQVILNIAINGRDAMPQGGKLTIETSNAILDQAYAASHVNVTPGEFVLLAITDTGQGIEPGILRQIFDPFFTTKPVGKGTGLGLSTTHGIIQSLSGSIEVYSEIGRGTCFKIYLPRLLVETGMESPGLPNPGPVLPSPGGFILVVEDNESIRRLVAHILEDAGYRVLVVASAEQALAIPNDELAHIDLLLTDVILEGISGPALAKELGPRAPDLLVLLMSGYTSNAMSQSGLLENGAELLSKPFTAAGLTAKIAEIIHVGKAKSRRALLDGLPS